MPSTDNSYPPLDVPKPVAEGVWVVDARPLHPGGLPLPIRMTVIRLSGGDLLLHSPSQFSPALAEALGRLGRIRHLVAPSFGHWMFVRDWQAAFPDATVWAAPGLRARPQVQSSGLRIDGELGETAPSEWGGDIEQVVLRGGPYAEVELFHRPSRTLVLTDLVLRLERERLPPLWRKPARMVGIVDPAGGTPAYLRALLRSNREDAVRAATRLLRFSPERVIFAHGDWFESDGAARLEDALSWLLPVGEIRAFAGRTVVITGASSGIGRAAALSFARRGARLVLAARRAEPLEAVAAECETLGGRAITLTTDVADAEAVEELAQAAEDGFGRIDVWINNAGAGVFGPFHETDLELHRRTIEVNLMGAVHGAAAALPRFLRQGSGTLINNVSLGAWAPIPFAAAYTASKFGLRGLTASLRQEMADHPDIHVCAVFPAVVDTPGFVHGANTSGRRLDPGPLLYRPEAVAEAFVEVARRPRAEVVVGWPSGAAKLAYAAAPRLTERIVNRAVRGSLSGAKPAPRTPGALLEPTAEGDAASGGWLRRKGLPSAPVLTGAVLAGAVAAIGVAAIRSAAGRR